MDQKIIKEIIKIIPTLLLYIVILIVFLRYRKPFVEGILPKISGFKAFGMEASFMHEMQAQQMNPLMIFYISHLDKLKGVPPGAFGITDDPNELIHWVLDAAERL